MREQLLALAGELEEYEGDTCEGCAAYEQPECRGYLPCTEIVAKYCARKVREIAGKGAEDVTTVSVYDLLPDEDRKALEWLRDNGGLDAVKRRLDWVVGHCSTEQQLDFDFWLSGRVMHELGFEEDMAERDDVERRFLARLMPDNMEWPRFEDGEPVRIGEYWGEEDYDTSTTFIERIIFAEDGVYLDNEYNEAFYRHGERVKRPAPKALDADGVEIRVGDTVWHVNGGGPYIVTNINRDTEHIGVTCNMPDGKLDWGFPASELQHEQPDDWSRWREDLELSPAEYADRYRVGRFGHEELDTYRDLVRRARNLAERGQ